MCCNDEFKCYPCISVFLTDEAIKLLDKEEPPGSHESSSWSWCRYKGKCKKCRRFLFDREEFNRVSQELQKLESK
jgi:hypothetical protein